jgi:hypothetical protein
MKNRNTLNMYVLAPLAVKDAHYMAVIHAAAASASGIIVFCARRSTCEARDTNDTLFELIAEFWLCNV